MNVVPDSLPKSKQLYSAPMFSNEEAKCEDSAVDERKSVLITGCSSGIGSCLAAGLKERGYRVFATARKSEDVQRLKESGFESLTLDLDDSDSLRSAVAQVVEEGRGRLFALVNNGSYGQYGAIEDLSREAVRRQFETNVFGTHELTNLVLPIFRNQGYGRIVQISSVLGFSSLAYRGAYNASKHALEALSDTLRLELHGTEIYVILVEPGPIATRFRDNANEAMQEELNVDGSIHGKVYEALTRQLTNSDREPPFTLPPEAVLKKVVRALGARRPRQRYRVTFPTHAFALFKRLLPGRLLDRILLAASGAREP